MDLTEIQKQLLETTAIRLIEDLRNNLDVESVKAMALDLNRFNDKMQVQIIVTRDQYDFMDFFTTEHETNFTDE